MQQDQGHQEGKLPKSTAMLLTVVAPGSQGQIIDMNPDHTAFPMSFQQS